MTNREKFKAESIEMLSKENHRVKMNAQETKRRGLIYCCSHTCNRCPLSENRLCIDDEGEIMVTYRYEDFITFAERFNKLIDELYPELANKENEK